MAAPQFQQGYAPQMPQYSAPGFGALAAMAGISSKFPINQRLAAYRPQEEIDAELIAQRLAQYTRPYISRDQAFINARLNNIGGGGPNQWVGQFNQGNQGGGIVGTVAATMPWWAGLAAGTGIAGGLAGTYAGTRQPANPWNNYFGQAQGYGNPMMGYGRRW
jgi:hypothetical protein